MCWGKEAHTALQIPSTSSVGWPPTLSQVTQEQACAEKSVQ